MLALNRSHFNDSIRDYFAIARIRVSVDVATKLSLVVHCFKYVVRRFLVALAACYPHETGSSPTSVIIIEIYGPIHYH